MEIQRELRIVPESFYDGVCERWSRGALSLRKLPVFRRYKTDEERSNSERIGSLGLSLAPNGKLINIHGAHVARTSFGAVTRMENGYTRRGY